MTDSGYNPYERFSSSQILLRDWLALDRTTLANERTLLAYVRTALTLCAAGITFIKFFEWPVMEIAGWVMIPAGIAIGLVGVVRFIRLQRRIGVLYEPALTTGSRAEEQALQDKSPPSDSNR